MATAKTDKNNIPYTVTSLQHSRNNITANIPHHIWMASMGPTLKIDKRIQETEKALVNMANVTTEGHAQDQVHTSMFETHMILIFRYQQPDQVKVSQDKLSMGH